MPSQDRLRILVVTNMYPPHHFGGYELSCQDVVDRMRARGHAVTVLTSDIRRSEVNEPAQDHVRPALRLYWDDHRLVSPSMRVRLANERHNNRCLREALDATTPDVVSVWNMGALSLGLLTTLKDAGVPVLLAVCNDWLVFGPDLDAWTRVFRRRRLARVTRGIVRRIAGVPTEPPDLPSLGTYCFVSHATRRWAEDHTGMKFEDSTVVYSGIAADEFPNPSDGERASTWRWRLLHVGRVAPERGIETAVRSLIHLPAQATLSLVGPDDGEERRRIERIAAELGLSNRIEFRERPRRELRAEYIGADVFVFPSVWEEPFGLAPIEAMACRVPVVATGSGGSAEFLVDGGNSLLFAKRDERALAEAVKRVAADEMLREELITAGTRTAAELTVDRLADCMEEWHVAVASRFERGRPEDRKPPRGCRA